MTKNILTICVLSFVSALLVLQPAAALVTPPPLTILPEGSGAANVSIPPAPSSDNSSLGTIQDSPDTVPLVPQRPVIISAFSTVDGPEFIQLYDDDSASKSPINMNGWRINVDYNDASSCSIEIDNAIFAHSYALLAEQNSSLATSDGAQVYSCPADPGAVVQQLRMYDHDELVERIAVPDSQSGLQWQRDKVTTSGRTGVFMDDFSSVTSIDMVNIPWYSAPPRPDLKVTEVLVNPRDCLFGDTDHTCYDYVKLKNTGQTTIDLSQYRLRTGFENTDARATNTVYLYGMLPAGATVRIDHNADGSPVSISANDGAVWLEDAYGIASYDLKVPPYIGSGTTAHQGQSWAYDAASSAWKWAVPSPMSVQNNFDLPAETKTSKTSVTQYVPCAVGQYRSQETHRCRSSTSATTTYKPCASNQTRSPVTHRCRGVLGASTTLKPCAKDQKRSPETNRCRKIQTKLATADFAVEPVKQGAKAFAGWWALGGLAVLAVGYASWEWRDEVRGHIDRIMHHGHSAK